MEEINITKAVSRLSKQNVKAKALIKRFFLLILLTKLVRLKLTHIKVIASSK